MSAPDGSVDLRSDTVTRPTPPMRAAMAEAEVGDDGYGEDPTVRRLETLAAALTGKRAALYVPSGTMANQLALHVVARRGTDVLCAERAHVFRYERAATPVNAGVQLRPLVEADGVLTAATVQGALDDAAHHLPIVSAVTVENTAMAASGRPWSVAEVTAVVDVARRHGIGVHCDGARIWNAAVATGSGPAELCAGVDTVMFCLSKGLGAPVGSLLCGAADAIETARGVRKQLGGAMRQAGIIAAAGVVALETMVDRLADDHERASRLAHALADRFPGSVDPDAVRTNIVCAALGALPDDFVARLGALGVRTGTIDARTVRLVTHLDVDDDDVARVVGALDELRATSR